MIELSILQENSEEKLKNSQKSYKFVQISQILLNILKFSKISKHFGNF